ncbi:DapH/DapD/GlmU-related protein [Flavobacterium sp.]|uniref:acyltransferase n=1 Tax=Flavobacterium sp. TaxID=239 RepID=UPI0026242703|nr:DapH/DapD/GlmU-related protein [Flavobacterium sp.]
MLKFFSDLFRFRSIFINAFYSSLYGTRLFFGVHLRSAQNILIFAQADIEKGSRIFASFPSDRNQKNIVIEDHCWIGHDVEIQTLYDSKIEIKEYASVQDRCKIIGSVSIGKYSILAPDIFISSGNHNYKSAPHLTIREQDKKHAGSAAAFNKVSKPVVIEEDCWIGKNVFIRQGIYVGRGAIIGTNAIVFKDIEPYTIHAGSPTEKIKDRFVFDPPTEISAFVEEQLPYFYRGFEHYSPQKSTVELLRENQGIASENKALAILKNEDWSQIEIHGMSRINGALSIFVNGQLHKTHKIAIGEAFHIGLHRAEIENTQAIAEYLSLPDFLKKHLCISFELINDNMHQKYHFTISKIKAS